MVTNDDSLKKLTVTVRLSATDIKLIEKLKRKTGESTSEVIRNAVRAADKAEATAS